MLRPSPQLSGISGEVAWGGVHLCGGKGLINGFFVVSLQLEFTGTGCSVVIVALQ